jgi:hypothetical protein
MPAISVFQPNQTNFLSGVEFSDIPSASRRHLVFLFSVQVLGFLLSHTADFHVDKELAIFSLK